MSSKLSAAIRAGLVLKGVGQSALAERLGVANNTVSRWVKDSHLPDKESLAALVDYFGWREEKVALLIEDWFENGHGERSYRIAGDEFVRSAFDGDYTKFLDRIIQIDEHTIVGINKEHEGTSEQWAPVFQSSPYTWKLLVSGQEIVGYWQFVCLKDKYYDGVLAGSILDSQITVEMIDFPVVEGLYSGYFCVIATLPQYRNTNSFSMLNRSITKTLSDFARNGVLFRRFCATAFSFEGKRTCELVGMKYVKRHPQAKGSEIADMFLIEGRDVKRSYWGRDPMIQRSYREAFG